MRNFLFILGFLTFFTACNSPIAMLKSSQIELTHYIKLPEKLDEISSLQYSNSIFIGVNDSGGEPEIYYFNQENPAQVIQTVRLSNAENIDWETTAESDSMLFVGDTGNNLGERHDLKIYFFDKENLNLKNKSANLNADTIGFFYPEQNVFKDHAYNHDFDCEAMVYFDNKLHLFTKEWKSEQTKHYSLDIAIGKQPAWVVERFDIGFLVTAADLIKVDDQHSRLALVGYNRDGEVFMMLTEFKNKAKKWLNHPKSILKLGVANDLGQVEGIAFKSKNEFCISAEAVNSDLGEETQNIRCFKIK